MTAIPLRWARFLVLATLAIGVASCGLPRSGPTKREIFSGSVQKQGDAFVVPVDDKVAQATSATPVLGFSPAFQRAGEIGSDEIHPGDVLGLTIWENVDDGLLAGRGQKTTVLSELQVDGAGFIFVPYAGRIRAAGNSPEALRRIITNKLDAQTPDPQVSVVRAAGDGACAVVLDGGREVVLVGGTLTLGGAATEGSRTLTWKVRAPADHRCRCTY